MGNNSNEKKPFYKLWWFWAIVAVVVFIIFSIIEPIAAFVIPIYVVGAVVGVLIWFRKGKKQQEAESAAIYAAAAASQARRAEEREKERKQAEQELQEVLATMQASIEDLKKLDQSNMTNKEMADRFIDFIRIFYDNSEKFGDYKAKYNDDSYLNKFAQLNKDGINCMSIYQDSDDKEILSLVTDYAKKLSERNHERWEKEREIRRQEEERELRLREVKAQEATAKAAKIQANKFTKCPSCQYYGQYTCTNGIDESGFCSHYIRK